MSVRRVCVVILFSAVVIGDLGCSSESTSQRTDSGAKDTAPTAPDQALTPDGPTDDDGAVPDQGPPPPDGPPSPDTSSDGPNLYAKVTCSTPPPKGAPLAADPKPYSHGTCPVLEPGYNDLKSKADQRRFLLIVPENPKPDEVFPVIFMWHWLKGKAKGFLEQGQAQQAANDQRFIGIAPEAKGAFDLFGLAEMPWPFTTLDTDQRMAEEFAFFDDMLSCVAEQYNINRQCVSTMGVSAGALFSAQLVMARSQYLSSLISLSGGTGGGGLANDFLRAWVPTPHKLPSLVLWGGPTDSCITINFQTASLQLAKGLEQGGHFLVECVHNCKHGEPPLFPPAGVSKYAGIWEFAFAHPYWLPPGASPLKGRAQPVSYLDWCGVGLGGAPVRTGECDDPDCPI